MKRFKVIYNSTIFSPFELENWLHEMYEKGWDFIAVNEHMYIFRSEIKPVYEQGKWRFAYRTGIVYYKELK